MFRKLPSDCVTEILCFLSCYEKAIIAIAFYEWKGVVLETFRKNKYIINSFDEWIEASSIFPCKFVFKGIVLRDVKNPVDYRCYDYLQSQFKQKKWKGGSLETTLLWQGSSLLHYVGLAKRFQHLDLDVFRTNNTLCPFPSFIVILNMLHAIEKPIHITFSKGIYDASCFRDTDMIKEDHMFPFVKGIRFHSRCALLGWDNTFLKRFPSMRYISI